jgi:hypothetical protein
MKLKKIIEAIKENLLNNETCDACNQLLTECDCDEPEHNHNKIKEQQSDCE